jgi:hypothetical protein
VVLPSTQPRPISCADARSAILQRLSALRTHYRALFCAGLPRLEAAGGSASALSGSAAKDAKSAAPHSDSGSISASAAVAPSLDLHSVLWARFEADVQLKPLDSATRSQLLTKAYAWYSVAYTQTWNDPAYPVLLGFAWVMDDLMVLLRMA